MKKTLSFVFAIAAFVLMFIGFTGCGRNDTPPISIISYPEGYTESRMYFPAEKGTLHVKVLNRSGTETIVLRKSGEKGTAVIPPGEVVYIESCEKGKSFKLKADGYSGSIKVKVPKE